MVDVFISYSRADEAKVRQLAHKIEAEGYVVWWDADLPPHKSYGEVIEEKVGSAKAAVVVWSPTAAASEWVRAEADMARNQKKLIQTALGDVMPPLPFNQIQFADIGDWKGEDDHSGWRKVKASLSELCGEPAACAVPPSPRPAPPPPPPPQPAAASPSKWPLFAGIGIAALAIVGSVAFFAGALSGNGDSDRDETDTPPIAVAGPVDTPVEPEPTATPERTPTPTPAPAATNLAAVPSASRGRVVGCYFWNSVYEYDGRCRFVAGQDGDFTTFALDGPYFEQVVRIDLDVISPGNGVITMHYPDGSTVPVRVQRSNNDRACWDGPRLTFCAR